MKLKSILFFAALITLSMTILSCGPGTCVCRCNTSSTKSGQDYNVGNISLSDAKTKCIALKSQYGWDTCMATQEKQ
jgi:hypothetical protein